MSIFQKTIPCRTSNSISAIPFDYTIDDNGNYVFNTNCMDGDSGADDSGFADIELTTDLSPKFGNVQKSIGRNMSRIQEFLHSLLQFLVKKR